MQPIESAMDRTRNALWTWRLYQPALLGLLTFSSSVILRPRYLYSSGKRSGEVCARRPTCNTKINQTHKKCFKAQGTMNIPWLPFVTKFPLMQFKQGWLSSSFPTSARSSLAFPLSSPVLSVPGQPALLLPVRLEAPGPTTSGQQVELHPERDADHRSREWLSHRQCNPSLGHWRACLHLYSNCRRAVWIDKQCPPATYVPMLIAAKYCEMTLFPLSIVLCPFFFSDFRRVPLQDLMDRLIALNSDAKMNSLFHFEQSHTFGLRYGDFFPLSFITLLLAHSGIELEPDGSSYVFTWRMHTRDGQWQSHLTPYWCYLTAKGWGRDHSG